MAWNPTTELAGLATLALPVGAGAEPAGLAMPAFSARPLPENDETPTSKDKATKNGGASGRRRMGSLA